MLNKSLSIRSKKIGFYTAALAATLALAALPANSFAGGRDRGHGGSGRSDGGSRGQGWHGSRSYGGGSHGEGSHWGGWDRGHSRSSFSVSLGFGNVFGGGRYYDNDCYYSRPARVVYRDYGYYAPSYATTTYCEPTYYAPPVVYYPAPVRDYYYSSDTYCAPRYQSDVSVRYTYRR